MHHKKEGRDLVYVPGGSFTAQSKHCQGWVRIDFWIQNSRLFPHFFAKR